MKSPPLKILVMPPLLVDGSFISDYCEKANLFNNFFASICIPIKNKSVLPPFLYQTNTRISYCRVTNRDKLSITKSLGSSKSHGYNSISIKMITICSESVTVHSNIIFEESLKKEFVEKRRIYLEKNTKL